MTRKKSLPWSSWRAFLITLLFALSMAPFEALRAVGVLISGKRLRAWNHLIRMAEQHPNYYRYWSEYVAVSKKRDFIGSSDALARVALHLIPNKPEACLGDTITRLAEDGFDWVVFHAPKDQIDPDIGAVIAKASELHGEAVVLYWDEEWALDGGLLTPWLKPEWSDWLHKARDCLTGACAIRLSAARTAFAKPERLPADRSGFAAMVLALASAEKPPTHLPLILTRRLDPMADLKIWAETAPRLWPEWRFKVRTDGIPFLRVTPQDPARWPSVSVIIPTKDRMDLLRACLSGLARTRYPGQVEILVVDNGSVEPDSIAFLASLAGNVRVIRDDRPFNFSRLNNLACAQAKGEYLCLLNNDVEALDEVWLTAMMRIAVDPRVGVVGAQLLYPGGAIQHAGVAIGMGNAAGHIQRGVAPAALEHSAWHAVTREVTAVTAACLLVARTHYEAVGGLDEAGFAVAFNDVDFCLKLDAKGLINIYCAEARLIHAESRTRPDDYRPDQLQRFEQELALLQSRWHTPGFSDRRFSPLLSPGSERCLLRAS